MCIVKFTHLSRTFGSVSIIGNAADPGGLARVSPVSQCDSVRRPADWRRASEDSETYGSNPALAYGYVRRVEEGEGVRHLHGGVPGGRRFAIPTLHAYVPYALHRWLADAQSDMSQLHGAGRRRPTHQLRDQLKTGALQLTSELLWSKLSVKGREWSVAVILIS